MDWQWKAFTVTFGTVFLAELGDKTQIATINFAAKGYPVVSVFAGSAAALLVAAFMGASLGTVIYRVISPDTLSNVAGGLFIVMGILILARKI